MIVFLARYRCDPSVLVFSERKRCQHPHFTQMFQKAKSRRDEVERTRGSLEDRMLGEWCRAGLCVARICVGNAGNSTCKKRCQYSRTRANFFLVWQIVGNGYRSYKPKSDVEPRCRVFLLPRKDERDVEDLVERFDTEPFPDFSAK